MNLAKGRNGKIGRQIPGQGLQAKIVQPSGGGYHRNVYLSEGQIAADQNYFTAEEAKAKYLEAVRVQKIKNQKAAAQAQMKRNMMGVAPYQRLAKLNPMNEKLLRHFAKQKMMGSSSNAVFQTLTHAPTGATSGYHPKPRPPADFSNSGGNMHLVPSGQPKEPVVWRADYRQTLFKGNPLTRDGQYGPAVTDYDRFVRGVDVNQSVINGATMPIAGNTMLGRFEGKSKSLGGYLGRAMGNAQPSRSTRRSRAMGDAPSSDLRSRSTRPSRAMGGDYVYDMSDTVDVGSDTVDMSSYDPMFDDPSYWDTPSTTDSWSSFWDTGNTAPTADELAAATPDSPGVFDKIWTAAEVAADKSLPTLLQQQMLQALSSGSTVGTKGGTVVISHPSGAAPTAIGTVSTIPKSVIYASIGLMGVGLLLLLMKSRAPRTA